MPSSRSTFFELRSAYSSAQSLDVLIQSGIPAPTAGPANPSVLPQLGEKAIHTAMANAVVKRAITIYEKSWDAVPVLPVELLEVLPILLYRVVQKISTLWRYIFWLTTQL